MSFTGGSANGNGKIFRLTQYDADGRPMNETERLLEFENGQMKLADPRNVALIRPQVEVVVAPAVVPWTFYSGSMAVLIGFVVMISFYHILTERYYGYVTSLRGSNTSFFDHAVIFGIVGLMLSTGYYMARTLLIALFYSWGLTHLVDYNKEIKLPAGEFTDIIRFVIKCSLKGAVMFGVVTLCVALVLLQLIFIASIIDKPVSITYNGGSHLLSGPIDYISETWGSAPSFFSLSSVPVGAQPAAAMAGAGIPVVSQQEVIYDTVGRPIDPYQARFRQPRIY